MKKRGSPEIDILSISRRPLLIYHKCKGVCDLVMKGLLIKHFPTLH